MFSFFVPLFFLQLASPTPSPQIPTNHTHNKIIHNSQVHPQNHLQSTNHSQITCPSTKSSAIYKSSTNLKKSKNKSRGPARPPLLLASHGPATTTSAEHRLSAAYRLVRLPPPTASPSAGSGEGEGAFVRRGDERGRGEGEEEKN